MFKLFLVLLAALSLTVLFPGCATRQPMPRIDLAEPGWTKLTGQAVWHRPPDLELAGDLVLAFTNGQSFVEFTKGQFTVINAQRQGGRWNAEFFSKRVFSGRGSPPSRIPWLHLAEAVRTGSTPKGWTWTNSGGKWKLQNPRSGESIEGFFTE